MNNAFTLTIGVPVFNDIDFIEKSLESLKSQTFSDFTVIISDDGSCDGSANVCQKFTEQDKRFKYIRQPKNLGVSRNMEFLLNEATSTYFMWAADDDLWAPTFIEKLIKKLNEKENAICAFGNYVFINELNEPVSEIQNFDFSNENSLQRLKNFICNAKDTLGYGIYRTELIRGVKFPVWAWPNNKCAYNNIYPTICFYLSKGDYVHLDSEVLFYKRIKSESLINHQLPFPENSFLETMAYSMRKINLVYYTMFLISRANNTKLALKVSPVLFYKWMLLPVFYKWKHFIKIKLRINKKTSKKANYLY